MLSIGHYSIRNKSKEIMQIKIMKGEYEKQEES